MDVKIVQLEGKIVQLEANGAQLEELLRLKDQKQVSHRFHCLTGY
jgi:hypothetical protein